MTRKVRSTEKENLLLLKQKKAHLQSRRADEEDETFSGFVRGLSHGLRLDEVEKVVKRALNDLRDGKELETLLKDQKLETQSKLQENLVQKLLKSSPDELLLFS